MACSLFVVVRTFRVCLLLLHNHLGSFAGVVATSSLNGSQGPNSQ